MLPSRLTLPHSTLKTSKDPPAAHSPAADEVVHIFFLISFRYRFVVMLDWVWAYATYQRAARGILSSGDEQEAKAQILVDTPVSTRGRGEMDFSTGMRGGC